MNAKVHSYESFATLDGEGIRFAVFLKGCNLRCLCCHNPDTWDGEGIIIDSHELVKKIERYRPYFSEKGGVTLSGGEPLLQGAFVEEFFKLLKEKGISTALDTSGNIIDKHTDNILKFTDHLLLDIKQADNESYMKFAGCTLDSVLDFLEKANKHKVRTWIRTVIIPGINDREEFVEKIFRITQKYPCVEKYELLPFHTMGFSKYEKLKIDNPLKGYKALSAERLDELNSYLKKLNTAE